MTGKTQENLSPTKMELCNEEHHMAAEKNIEKVYTSNPEHHDPGHDPNKPEHVLFVWGFKTPKSIMSKREKTSCLVKWNRLLRYKSLFKKIFFLLVLSS